MDAVTRAISAAFGPVRMARPWQMPDGSVRAVELRPWANAIAANPEDAATRWAFADWLIERGGHHHEDDLHRLWSHPGPVFVTRHPLTKKAVVVPGPRETVHTLNEKRVMLGMVPLENNLGAAVHDVVHGTHGVVVVWGEDGYYPGWRATAVHRDRNTGEHTGRLDLDLDSPGTAVHGVHRTRQDAIRTAVRHAFGD